jgi:molybdate transport system substrate-binding protein
MLTLITLTTILLIIIFLKPKRLFNAFLFVCFGCLGFSEVSFAQDQLFVHAGAGLRPAIDKIAADFERQTGTQVLIDYAGSGQSLARINTTHKGDVFIPGSDIYLYKLQQSMTVDSIYKVALHTPVVGVNKSKADQIQTFSDLTRAGIRVGLGDPSSMALGRTAVSILDASGMADDIKKNTTVYAATIKQLTLYLAQGDIDAAIISRSDVIQNSDAIVKVEINADWYTPEVIATGVLGCAARPELARQFAQYVASSAGVQAFTDAGFLPYREDPLATEIPTDKEAPLDKTAQATVSP